MKVVPSTRVTIFPEESTLRIVPSTAFLDAKTKADELASTTAIGVEIRYTRLVNHAFDQTDPGP